MNRLLSASLLALAVVIGVLSMGLFGLFVWGLPVVGPRAPRGLWFLWDLILSLAFFLQHSGMVRRRFRARMAGLIPARFHGAVYAIVSGLTLSLVVVQWQPSGTRLLALEGPSFWLARACSALAIGALVLSAYALRSFDPFGLAPIKAHLRGRPQRPATFVVRGPYRWVRHPLYACVLVLIWTCPVVTADRLLFDVLWTSWIVVGATLEEVDLVAEFGEDYRAYRRDVPMLVPWRGRFAR